MTESPESLLESLRAYAAEEEAKGESVEGPRHVIGVLQALLDERDQLLRRVRSLEEVRVLDADQSDVTDKLTDLQNERDWALESLAAQTPSPKEAPHE